MTGLRWFRSKYEKLESALHQKEAEKQMIVNELMQSKQRQEVGEEGGSVSS